MSNHAATKVWNFCSQKKKKTEIDRLREKEKIHYICFFSLKGDDFFIIITIEYRHPPTMVHKALYFLTPPHLSDIIACDCSLC